MRVIFTYNEQSEVFLILGVMATRITNQKLSKSSRAWMREHLDDPFVKKAQKEGYRARAAYKLLEIQEKYKLIKPGMTVVDLGAAPGSWSQIAGKLVGSKGLVIASDFTYGCFAGCHFLTRRLQRRSSI